MEDAQEASAAEYRAEQPDLTAPIPEASGYAAEAQEAYQEVRTEALPQEVAQYVMHHQQLQYPPQPPPAGDSHALVPLDDEHRKGLKRMRDRKPPDNSRYRNRKDFRPGQGTRKRLEKAAATVVEEFKKAAREDPKLEAPLLRAMLCDPRMKMAVEANKIVMPVKGPGEMRKPKLEKIKMIASSARSEREADVLIVKHRYETGEVKKSTVLQLKSYCKTYKMSQLGNKQELLERVLAHLQGQPPPQLTHTQLENEELMENADELLEEVDTDHREDDEYDQREDDEYEDHEGRVEENEGEVEVVHPEGGEGGEAVPEGAQEQTHRGSMQQLLVEG